MIECGEIREAIQDGMDGPLEGNRREDVETHLRRCAECRDYREGMGAVRAALSSLPEQPFPDDALAAVWGRTVGSRGEERTLRAGWRDFGIALALAASVTLLFLPALFRPVRAPYSSPEIARADRDARRVLVLTSLALRRTERAALEQVLAGEVVPAVRRIPIRWSPSKHTSSRRPRT